MPSPSRPPQARDPRGLVLPVAALSAALLALACDRTPPPGAGPSAGAEASGSRELRGAPVLPEELAPRTEASAAPPAAPAASAEPAPYAGPYLVVTDSSAGVYSDTTLEKKKKFGYLRSGGKVPVLEGTLARDNCPRGWYRLRDGGFVCGDAGTTKLTSPEARFATRAPDPDGVLPYTYARNAKNGTPLYKSVPTAEQMREYEPYLVKKSEGEAAKAKKPPDGAKNAKGDAAGRLEGSEKPPLPERSLAESRPPPGGAPPPPAANGGAPAPAAADREAPAPFSPEAIALARARTEGTMQPASAATLLPAPGADELGAPDGGADEAPWWQREDADDRLHEVKLDALAEEADDVLAKRMVKGFYVAVDREFAWNGRPWYKTTKGLVTPADRFWVTKGSEFHGVDLDGEKATLPLGFAVGATKGRPVYQLDADGKLKPAGTVPHRGTVFLSGEEKEVAGKRYVQTKDGMFVLAAHLRITRPGPPPEGLLPDERWIDVNLTTQTLVAFQGTRPVYATLISSGKESKVKEKDHRTPRGEWRIREKHVTTTMDGDGSAAGDLPYSIEDVPYVMYYHRAFALHGAFWHSNYGSQMSHGCVNLSPLDAKWVFRFTEPHLPEGWHGVWATEEHPGSRVVVHE